MVLFFGIGLHEYAHCKFADLAGDPTPRYYGRVTLNLFKHFDPLGVAMILVTIFIGYGIGWGKPAPINPSKMRNPRLDTFIAVAAGPLSNIAQAVLYAIAFRILLGSGNGESDFSTFLFLGVRLNLGMAFFNLIPVGVLDGHWLVGELLPDPARLYWFKFNRTYGWQIFLVLIFLGQASPQLNVLRPLRMAINVVTGRMLGVEI